MQQAATLPIAPGRRIKTSQIAALCAMTLVAAPGWGILQHSRNSVPHSHDHATGMMQANASLRPTATTISSDALSHAQGKRITTMLVEFPPSGFSPPHHHGGSVTVHVLAGAIRSQIQGQLPGIYRPGETFFEPFGITHLVAENVSATEPARILAVFVADEDATLTTYHE